MNTEPEESGGYGIAVASAFEKAASLALDLKTEIDRLSSRPMLSAEAFRDGAAAAAEMSANRLREVHKLLEQRAVELPTVAACRRGLIKLIKDGRVSHVPRGHRLLSILRASAKSEGLIEELASVHVRPSEFFASVVADFATAEPDRFGFVRVWSDHEAQLAELRQKLQAAYDEMRNTLSSADILVRSHHRLDGLDVTVRVVKKARHLSADSPDMPRSFVAHLASVAGLDSTYGPAAPKRLRRRLAALDAHEAAAAEIDQARSLAERAGVLPFFERCQLDGKVDWWLQRRRGGMPSSEIGEMIRNGMAEVAPATFIQTTSIR